MTTDEKLEIIINSFVKMYNDSRTEIININKYGANDGFKSLLEITKHVTIIDITLPILERLGRIKKL